MADSRNTKWSDLYEQIGRCIRGARRDAGLTQDGLAAAISLSRTSVVNIERGRQKMLVHTLYDIALALNRDVASLLPKVPVEAVDDLAERIPGDLSDNEREWIESVVSDADAGD